MSFMQTVMLFPKTALSSKVPMAGSNLKEHSKRITRVTTSGANPASGQTDTVLPVSQRLLRKIRNSFFVVSELCLSGGRKSRLLSHRGIGRIGQIGRIGKGLFGVARDDDWCGELADSDDWQYACRVGEMTLESPKK